MRRGSLLLMIVMLMTWSNNDERVNNVREASHYESNVNEERSVGEGRSIND